MQVALRDVLRDGFGVPPESCDAVLLFNILHGEEPVAVMCQRLPERIRGGEFTLTRTTKQ